MTQQQFLPKQKNKQIGNYSIGKIIGKGTFASVREAIHVPTGQKVSIKILSKDMIIDSRDKLNLSRQIRILRKVRHPNIAQLLQMMETNSKIYLVLQYVSNGQLFNSIVSSKKGRLSQKKAAILFQQLLDAVEYLHDIGITHRDIKPQNIMLDQNGNAKLIDFGLGNFYQKGQTLGTACGSPCYAAPQMLCQKQYDPKLADIWSCGVVLYAMVCGYLPFQHQSTKFVYQKIKIGKYQEPPFLSQQVKKTISMILKIEACQRPSIQQIRREAFCSQYKQKSIRGLYPGEVIKLEQDILEQMRDMGMVGCRKDIQKHKNSKHTATYFILLYKILHQRDQNVFTYYRYLDSQNSIPIRSNSLVLKRPILQAIQSFRSKRMTSSQQNQEQIDFLERLSSKNKSKIKHISTTSLRIRKVVL